MTQPILRASSEPTLLASMESLRNWALPIFLYTYGPMTAGRMPSFPSERAILVLGSAMTWSKHATNPAPPPSATPWTRPMVKQGCDHRELNSVSKRSESLLFSSGVEAPASLIMLMSAPAQKCLPSPPSTKALRYGFPDESFNDSVKPTDL